MIRPASFGEFCLIGGVMTKGVCLPPALRTSGRARQQ